MLYHGNILSQQSQGTNELIKQGAIPVTCIEDFYQIYEKQQDRMNSKQKIIQKSKNKKEILKTKEGVSKREMEEKKEITIETKQITDEMKKKQKNVKLYPKYKMLSWDMLFYYAIIFLFFTETKGISAADVLLAESFYPLFKVLLLMPSTIVIDKIR